ncbi:hypothetical protein M406DRAFT_108145 [Cryphonectria parasitica EP155]|uniref:FHA domain-containing protein n=1 Tax=Cryphonectria parasitica (strain ATCC 38755 / EP155) TaxID=660469 RepID=A0A9P4XTF3_CRYP1|nr:uncharacterized protein M406DRAFT_108145 [Cryphonectria parasitica EP155]KAF3760576.1 hypothetical protein M406DRAFT_108145 [Cryphonectria parasitica EP155]
MNHTGMEEEEDRVVVRLSIVTPNDISFPERRIVLTKSRPLVRIGRSSNRPYLDIQCAVDNGWFDSPVMSRHHAEIKAEFRNKAITIRDSSSMHGTYLNNVKICSERTLRANDQLLFGVPVYRNERTFQPATMKVNSVAFIDADRPTTSPNRVFTVPDDCSTDDNELLDESMDEPLPNCSVGPANNHNEKDVSHPEPSDIRQTSIPQVDGAIDLISDAESAHGAGSESYEESILLSDDDIMCSEAEGSLESLDLSDISEHRVEEAISAYRHTFSPDSAGELTDGDSDDHSSLSGNEAEGVFLYDTDSDDMNAVEPSDMTRLSEHPGEPREPSSLHPLYSQAPDSTVHRLPSLNTMFPPGEWDSIPRTEPFSGITAPVVTHEVDMLGAGPRAPSPSDAALPHGPRRTGVASNNPQGLSSLVEKGRAEASDEGISAATMGQKSGKPIFFEAREHNKLAIARITDQASAPEPTSPVSMIQSSTSNRETSCVDKSAGSEAQPLARIPMPPSLPHNHAVEDERGEASMANHRNSAASWADYDPYGFEPASAYELHLLKLRRNEQASDAPSIVPNQDVQADTVPISGDLHQDYGLDKEDEASKQKDNKGKRKAAEISELSEADLAWARRTLMPETINESQVNEVPRTPPPRPTLFQSPLPSPPTTPGETGQVEARPAKRMRKFAERVGYAALGGATVGAVVLTSLIYTAPTFV